MSPLIICCKVALRVEIHSLQTLVLLKVYFDSSPANIKVLYKVQRGIFPPFLSTYCLLFTSIYFKWLNKIRKICPVTSARNANHGVFYTFHLDQILRFYELFFSVWCIWTIDRGFHAAYLKWYIVCFNIRHLD